MGAKLYGALMGIAATVFADSAEAQLPSPMNRPALEIGVRDGPTEHIFGRIVNVVVDSVGNLFVLNGQNPRDVAAQDTVVLRAENQPVWGNAPRLVEELRIGMVDGDERYTFGRVVAVTVGNDGTVWVADWLLRGIRRFDAHGRFIDVVGRRGEGPGEFNRLESIRSLSDGSVVAWDPILQRVSRFSSGGQFIGSFALPTYGGIVSGKPFEVDVYGNAWAISIQMHPERLPTSEDINWVRATLDGQVIDSVFPVFPPRASETATVLSRQLAVPSPHGYLVSGRNDDFAFHIQLRDGRTFRIERTWGPVPIQDAERAELLRLEATFAPRRGTPPRPVPERKPVWSSFDVDAEGRIWIERYGAGVYVSETDHERDLRESIGNPPREWRNPIIYDVIEAGGRYMGSLRFPGYATLGLPNDRVGVAFSRGNEVWTVERGALDEQYIVRYRVEP